MKSSSIKIAHLTDIHIGETPALQSRSAVDVRANFRKILKRTVEDSPDLIALGGDQAYNNGEIEAYKWLKSELEKVEIPYCVMAGNHDLMANLTKVFDLGKHIKNGELFYQKEIQGKSLFFLDSSSGRISSSQLEWLRSEAGFLEQEALLFIHHPPILAGCRFMDDNHLLKNWPEALSALEKISNVKNIICGHYHTEKVIVHKRKNIFITPSVMLQISQINPQFEVASYRPGRRVIEWDGERLDTRADYI